MNNQHTYGHIEVYGDTVSHGTNCKNNYGMNYEDN